MAICYRSNSKLIHLIMSALPSKYIKDPIRPTVNSWSEPPSSPLDYCNSLLTGLGSTLSLSESKWSCYKSAHVSSAQKFLMASHFILLQGKATILNRIYKSCGTHSHHLSALVSTGSLPAHSSLPTWPLTIPQTHSTCLPQGLHACSSLLLKCPFLRYPNGQFPYFPKIFINSVRASLPRGCPVWTSTHSPAPQTHFLAYYFLHYFTSLFCLLLVSPTRLQAPWVRDVSILLLTSTAELTHREHSKNICRMNEWMMLLARQGYCCSTFQIALDSVSDQVLQNSGFCSFHLPRLSSPDSRDHLPFSSVSPLQSLLHRFALSLFHSPQGSS